MDLLFVVLVVAGMVISVIKRKKEIERQAAERMQEWQAQAAKAKAQQEEPLTGTPAGECALPRKRRAAREAAARPGVASTAPRTADSPTVATLVNTLAARQPADRPKIRLKGRSEAQRAFIYSEIFNQKY